MAHCPFEQLSDLKAILDEIRILPGMREPKPGIFYFKSKPFLHFHIKEGRRWADVREKAAWGKPLDIPFQSGVAVQKKFLTQVHNRYASVTKKTGES